MKTVYTKEELEEAIRNSETEISIEGDLARHVHDGNRLKAVGPAALSLLAGSIAAIPLTSGLSAVALAPIVALTGVEIALIVAAVVLGIGFLKAMWDDYEEVEFDWGPPPRAKIRRRGKKQ